MKKIVLNCDIEQRPSKFDEIQERLNREFAEAIDKRLRAIHGGLILELDDVKNKNEKLKNNMKYWIIISVVVGIGIGFGISYLI